MVKWHTGTDGLVTGAGLNITHTKRALRRALEVWNDEAHANVVLRWGGDTTATRSSTDVIVRFVSNAPNNFTLADIDQTQGATCGAPWGIRIYLKKQNGTSWQVGCRLLELGLN